MQKGYFRKACTALAAVGALLPPAVSAQSAPLVVEMRGGAAAPVGSFHNGTGPGEGATSGVSLGFDLAFSGSGRRTFYVGFSQHRFACEVGGCPSGADYVATGFDAGFRFSLLTRGAVIPWLRVGAVTSRVESPGFANSAPGLGSTGYGGEVGVGVYLGAWSTVAFNPGIRLTRVNTNLPGDVVLRMRYIVADLGLSLAF